MARTTKKTRSKPSFQGPHEAPEGADDATRLLAQIKADPDDDAARLVYADFLQHHGQSADDRARGELIVIQCALAGLGTDLRASARTRTWSSTAAARDWLDYAYAESTAEIASPVSDEARRLELREATLLKAHLKAWVLDVSNIGEAEPTSRYFRFERGFLGHVSMTVAAQPKAAVLRLDALLDAAPFATSLSLIDGEGSAETFALLMRAGALEQLRSLDFGRSITRFNEGVTLLTQSPRLGDLVRLEGQLAGSMTSEMRALRRARIFENLEVLDLSTSPITNALTPDLPGRLQELHLRSCALTSHSVEAIAKSTRTSALRVLDLRDNAILGDGFGRLMKTRGLAELRALNVSKNGLTTTNALALLGRAGAFEELRTLVLSKISRGVWDPKLLRAADGPPHLVDLDLEDTMFDDDAIAAFVRSPLYSRLRSLSLRKNLLTDEGARAIADAEESRGLRVLKITDNRMTKTGHKQLVDSKNLEHARILTSRVASDVAR